MVPVKVLYDDQVFTAQPFGGISRYYVELMDRYQDDPEIEFNFSCYVTKNVHLGEKPYYKRTVFNSRPGVWLMEQGSKVLKQNIPAYVNRFFSSAAVRSQDYDIFHPTYYDPYFLKNLGRKPLYLIVHDMIHEIFSDIYKHDRKTTPWKRALVDRADHITTVSANTKKDLCRIFGVDESRVQVIHQGCSLAPSDGAYPLPVGIPTKYLLYVGGRWTYKNFDGLLEALAPIMAKDRELGLVCAGSGPINREEAAIIERLDLGRRVSHVAVEGDDHLIALYRNAAAFVFPSKYEGFGLPVLEAMTCDCPTLLSNNSSLPEVGGDAGVYFDPYNVSSMTEMIEKVLTDETLRKRTRELGHKRVTEFSWDNTARETKKVYLDMATDS
jgi:glycosyltransferase involved in cell wall biosynthesis